ncbi:MAG: hypothetical protein K2O88_04290, partial [Paramuribaculum sp.]|nr:hypothetical protein [Paramuribaculum sp.]
MKKTLLLIGGLTFATMAMNAQQLRGPESETDTRQPYIQWPSSYSLDQYIQNWTPGVEITRSYGENRVVKEGWEDEEFFTSRVKLRPLIRNSATQIYEEYSENNDKRLLFWVPCGMSTGYFQTGALPNAVFDSEAFSTWSYVTHYGNWTSPYGWVPGAFADAAHKHGVLVSGVASIPWAQNANTGNWGNALNGMVNLASSDEGLDKVAKFLRYHGVDGLGYNSEFSASSTLMNGIRNLHGKLVKKMVNDYGAAGFENPWYAFTTDAGGMMDGSYLSSSYYQNFGYSDEPRTIMFLNYNWNSAYRLSTTAQGVSATGRAPQDVYLGMNMQGGMSSDGTDGSNEWATHLNHPYSIGLWGEHSKNMLYPARTSYGGSDMLKQKGYQRVIEQWFGNGRRNPAAKMNISSSRSLSPDDNFHGMSRLMTARSAYGWSLDDEPFITYFSLGNGLRYYMDGEVANNTEWYNLGMQDYTPTWRFWWADKMLGKTPNDIPANSMDAEYTWEDAWNGGSSLKISGSTSEGQSQYLHLFKTAFSVKNNDVITIRYKILKGNGDINFVYSKVGSESTEQTPAKTAVHKTSDQFFYDEWNEVQLKVAARGSNVLSAGDWATLGLKFTNAKDLEVLIGEMSIKRGTSKTPTMPIIRRGKVLSDVVTGFDAKLIWTMPNNVAPGDPVYNVDVNTSHFELWAHVEGEEPQFMGTTTSWGGLMFRIANPEHKKRVKLGVQAVSLDHKSKSGITWSNDYYDAPSHEVSEEVKIDKTCIKPGQEFRIWFIDELHPNATLTLYSNLGKKVASNNGTSRELVTSLDQIGAYDLVANEGTNLEKRYSCFAQVSDFSVGAIPEIQSLTIEGSEPTGAKVEFGMGTEFKVGYTGAEADGSGSRGITSAYKLLGGPIKEMQLGQNKSFSVSYWIRLTDLPASGSLNLFGIEDRTGSWPENNWGFFWANMNNSGYIDTYCARGNSSNTKGYNYRYPKTTVVSPGAWTHVTHVFDYDAANAMLMKLYINGVYQVPEASGLDEFLESNVVDGIPVRGPNRSLPRDGMWIHILGGRGSTPGYSEAIIDDVVIWDGSVSESDIAKAMVGLDANNLPSNVKCFWDFENEPMDGISETRNINGKNETTIHNGRFMSKGQITNAPFGTFDLLKAEGEGQSMQTNITPIYEAGCPYVKGSAFAVETKPTWSTRQATISNASGNDTKGEATVVYGSKGEKTLTLNLKNSWGEDNQTYPVILVGDPSSIDCVEANDAAKVYTNGGVGVLKVGGGGGGDAGGGGGGGA